MRIILAFPLFLALLAGCAGLDVKNGAGCRYGADWNGAPSTIVLISGEGIKQAGGAVRIKCGEAYEATFRFDDPDKAVKAPPTTVTTTTKVTP